MELPSSGWSFAFLLLFLELPTVLLIESYQISLNETFGQSTCLPFPFRLKPPVPDPLTIKWTFNGHETLGSFTGRNCSISADEGNLIHCANESFIQGPRHQHRVNLSPKIPSLLLHNLTLSDSGVYNVTISGVNNFGVITLMVIDFASTTESATSKPSGNTGNNALSLGLIVGICCIFIFSVLLLFLLVSQSPIVRAKLALETKTIKQRKEPSPIELRLENLPPGPDAIYDTIREDQMKYLPTSDQLTLYSTVQLPVEYSQPRSIQLSSR
ncbi:uncharacterized protein LOC103171097 isoform X1 [Ornithorhynchus anatinus]|uniref:uncharacterized protein LOC103171097 isoform X1 n=1 Tax=Ornithorhynchus anatinus TaxID=9258 RepID=UPI0010A94032|nr:uncharacterized protein LOC103171097 isoform X1 [Ornithorhynchus anatinus]XP_028922976.1 uncharacterized protein LOC103171097 isoform X1 [Ornithorhynchus anatinus]